MEITLGQLCKRRQIKQSVLAARVGVERSVVSNDVNRSDMRVSRLNGIIKALGGKLVLRAEFPGVSYVILLDRIENMNSRGARQPAN